MDWSNLTELFLVGGFPWISQFRRLEFHFSHPGIKIKSIYNFFASLFAMGIFAYRYYVNPYQLIKLPDWWYFLLSSCILTILYFSIYMYKKEQVEKGENKGIVIVNFVIYILIFSSLTTCFGLLKVFKDYVIIKGHVISDDGKATRAELNIYYTTGDQSSFKSNDMGNFAILLVSKDIDKINRIEAKSNTGESFSVNTFGVISVFDHLKEIQLLK